MRSAVLSLSRTAIPARGIKRLRGVRHSCQLAKTRLGYQPVYGTAASMAAFRQWYRIHHGMDTDFCVAALKEALDRYGKPEIFNTDQGVQFTSGDFLAELQTHGVGISMDGKGRYLDNIFIERLWRSLKYEEIFLKAYGSVAEARCGIAAWLGFYNDDRPHQALDYLTPFEVHSGAPACGYVDNARKSVDHIPTGTAAARKGLYE